MGVEYMNCSECDEIICDAGEYPKCDNCHEWFCSVECGDLVKGFYSGRWLCKKCRPECNYCKQILDEFVECEGCSAQYCEECFEKYFDVQNSRKSVDKDYILYTVDQCGWCDECPNTCEKCQNTCEKCWNERYSKIHGIDVSCGCGYKYLCKACKDRHDCKTRIDHAKIRKFIEKNKELVTTHLLKTLSLKKIQKYCKDLEGFPND